MGTRAHRVPRQLFVGELLALLAETLFWILRHVAGVVRALSRTWRPTGAGTGHTVLVTTGRQAKTLHTVRALHDVGARVIVTDYDSVSSSALSVGCDKFVKLPALNADKLDEWIDAFERVIVEEGVDTVLPVSTINEVLFVGAARDRLQSRLPHVRWLCPTLEQALLLDDRAAFSEVCEEYGVRAPISGMATSRSQVPVEEFKGGLVCKRIESTVHRNEEVIWLEHSETLPSFVEPSASDPWQWQERIHGVEMSAWYVCENGRVTFSSCFLSAPDLVHFDDVERIPSKVDGELRQLIGGLHLSGQYAFDFMMDPSGDCYVFECNPRASSALCTVSKTPLWAECFFGGDIPNSRTVHSNVGYLFHRNCWPFDPRRSDGFVDLRDPVPLLCAEVAWPLWAIGRKGCTPAGWRKVDCNIGKIIVDGPSPARNISVFREERQRAKLNVLRRGLAYVDVVYVDISGKGSERVLNACYSVGAGCKVVPFALRGNGVGRKDLADVVVVDQVEDLATNAERELGAQHRVVLSEESAKKVGFKAELTLLIPRVGKPLRSFYQVPLRRIRVLHVMGSCTSRYYEHLSSLYGYQCVESVTDAVRFEHVVAYVHGDGSWSVETGKSLSQVVERSRRMPTAEAIGRIAELGIDVMLPHMFDFVGLTSYRSLFTVLGIAAIGCSGDALALSTNKARTKACAADVGVPVPKSEVLRLGEKPSIGLPFVIKPTEEDNSQGVCVVRDADEVVPALEKAFEFGHEVMCEEFIPLGRELRTGVVECEDGSLRMLPVMEYFLTQESPIRRPEDKLQTNASGIPDGLVKCSRACPADVDECLWEKLHAASAKAHVALGCQDYSIYDFRVDPEGNPHMLESSLYCSFSPSSAIVLMARGAGIEHPKLFVEFCERAYARGQLASRSSGDQLLGMKQLSS